MIQYNGGKKMKLAESLLYENLNYIPAAYYLKTFEPDFDMNFHVHDYFEIMYAVSGSFKILTKNLYGNVEEKVISEGQFVMIDANNMHRLLTFETCKICNLEITCEVPSDYSDFTTSIYLKKTKDFRDFADTLQDNAVLNDTENILSTLKHIHSASDKDKKDFESYLRIQSLMLYLFIDIGRCYRNTYSTYQSIYITKCLNIINNNISEKLSPSKIAKSLGISESYLHRQFKTHLGITFSGYVNIRRIELAKNLLINSNDSISKISESVGFCTRQYFNTIFNRCEKTSPANFRKLNRQKQYQKANINNYLQTQINSENKATTLYIPKNEWKN